MNKPWSMTHKKENRILKLWRKNFTFAKIARTVGCSPSTAREICLRDVYRIEYCFYRQVLTKKERKKFLGY